MTQLFSDQSCLAMRGLCVARRLQALLLAGCCCMGLTACAPEVGSKRWCEQMEKKDRGEWTFNDTADYARHCLLR